MNLYRLIWSNIGGRPWTYIIRDVYHKAEYIWIVSLFIAGFTIGMLSLLTWPDFLIIMAAYTIGYIHGHFFWGTKYINGQQGNHPKGTP